MILRSVELESFGRFKGHTVEFRRGMNLVIGPNEAGKSTLAEAVPAVLFGSNHLEKYKPWGRNACSASLFFEGSGRTIKVRRDLLTDDVELVEKDDMYHILSQFSGKAPLRGRSASCREYRELVASLLGVGDDKLFRATYFFGHHPQEWTGDELAQNLRTLVSGTAEVDYAEVLDELLEEHFSLTSENPWGRDKKQDREYEKICRQVEETGAVETVPVFVEIDNNEDVREQIEELSAELVNDRLEHEKGQRYIEKVRDRLSRTTPAAEEVKPPVAQSKESTNVKNSSLSERLESAGLPSDPPSELPSLLAEAAEIRQEMAQFQQPYSVLSSKEKKAPVVPWGLIGSVLLFCLAGTVLAWWFAFQPQLVSLCAAAVSSLSICFGAWRHLARKKVLAECKKQKNLLDQRKIAAQAKQSELSERCETLNLPSSPIDLVRLQKLVAANRELLEAYWSNDDELPFVEDRSVDDKIGASDEQPVVNSFVELADDNGELEELKARMAEFEALVQEKEARLKRLKQQLQDKEDRIAEPGASGNSTLHKRKRELQERIAVLRKSIDLLASSVDEFGRSHLVKLNEEAGRVFGKITSGRYKEVRLDENMLPSVRIDGRRWVSVDSFSRGTVDAIYLALRIALAKVRDDGRSLPLMLDDPFVHLDHKRLGKAMNMVDLASADGQLILFSHNMELGKRAAKERWHVVPLDGDTVEPIVDEEEGGEHAGQLHLL